MTNTLEFSKMDEHLSIINTYFRCKILRILQKMSDEEDYSSGSDEDYVPSGCSIYICSIMKITNLLTKETATFLL